MSYDEDSADGCYRGVCAGRLRTGRCRKPRCGAGASADVTASLLTDYKWRSIGPASAGGRITDVEALETDFSYVIVASASGGVWKSTNAGTTWTPIFDHYGTSSIGDIKIFQGDRNLIWVGPARQITGTVSPGAMGFTNRPMGGRRSRTWDSGTRSRLRAS